MPNTRAIVTAAKLFAVVSLLLLAAPLLYGCQDDSAQMAQQIGRGRQGTQVKPTDSSSPEPGDKTEKPLIGKQGDEKPGEQKPGKDGAEQPGDGTIASPEVEVLEFKAKPPHVEYDGPGRYDVYVTVKTKEKSEPGVWKINLLDENQQVVGSQEQFLVIPSGQAKPLMFLAFYSKSAPSTIQFLLTDKKAAEAGGAAEESAGGGRSIGSAGGMGGGAAKQGEGGGGGGGGSKVGGEGGEEEEGGEE